jgi:DNA-binding PadR family transcriptional regulator
MNHHCNHQDGRDARRAWKQAARAFATMGATMGAGIGRAGWGAQRWAGSGGVFGSGGPFGFGGPFAPGGPFGPRGPWGPGGRGRGRGRRGQFGRDELRLILLKLLAEQPRHGYDLIKAIEAHSGGHYSPSPGVIYPALAMLADEGLIAEQESGDQRRKFAITPAGEAVLAAEAEQVDRAMGRLDALAEHAERNHAPSIQRASMNLFTAVGQRMAEGSEDDELAHRIAEILDEAARKVERL